MRPPGIGMIETGRSALALGGTLLHDVRMSADQLLIDRMLA